MKYAIAIAAFLASSPAIADDALHFGTSAEGTPPNWTMQTTRDAILRIPQEMIVLGASGCIRGPFKVIGEDHLTVFEIGEGIFYPPGCSK